MLPDSLPEARALKAFQEVFSRNEELVVLLESKDGEADVEAAAGDLAERLTSAGLAASARWQPRWREQPEGLGDLFAWLWLNGEPEEVDQLSAALSEARSDETLQAALERVATAMDGGDVVMASHDPFGLLDHPSLRGFFQGAEQGGGGFTSGDGHAQLLFVDAPDPLPGYKEAHDWLARLSEVTGPWSEETGVTVRFTGDPAFEAEIGTAMEKDMRGTISITSVLIGGLFLLMQRRVGLLVGLSLVLGMVFVTAMGIAGWIYGELSIMAAGFAAILIGLAVDYGVLICQEAKVCGHETGRIRAATSKSIVWASLTTASVFFALNLSGMPGISQLGSVVAVGILAGAALMLVVFVPWVARFGAGRPEVAGKRSFIPSRRPALIALGISLVAAAAVLLSAGFPGVAFDRALLRPRNCEAMTTLERLQEVFPEWGKPAMKIVVEGADDREMADRLDAAATSFEALKNDWPEQVKSVDVPTGWWPRPGRIEANRGAIAEIGAEKDRLLAEADEAGFSEEGLALAKMVFTAMPEVAEWPADRMPSGPAVDEILRTMISRDGSGGRVLGTLELKDPDALDLDDLGRLRAACGEGTLLAGWPLLKPAVLPLVKDDIVRVFLPMAGLMVVMLTLVFRNVRDVAASVVAMTVSGLLLLAVMRLCGLEWNFLNIAATPLLLGTGLDYGIHILLAMRRTGGDLRHVWNGTGKAVVFCGASTAIGFGSLGFASIDALASLGQVALIGILISMAVSVLLLPALRGAR